MLRRTDGCPEYPFTAIYILSREGRRSSRMFAGEEVRKNKQNVFIT
jgi:hypothetical protein